MYGKRRVASSKMVGVAVKSALPAFFGFIVLLTGAAVARGERSGALVEFWRSVFARPVAGAAGEVSGENSLQRELGGKLFLDTRLSGSGERSCASCHMPERGFTDGRKRGLGIDGGALARNVPTLFNVGWGKSFNWDGSAPSLERQALGPILRPNEMGGDFAQIVGRLSEDKKLSGQFAAAFPTNPKVSKDNILSALAAYERSLVAPLTRFDRWISGDNDALTASEQAGFGIFVGKGGCVACHAGWRFSDEGFHDIGLEVALGVALRDVAGKKGVMAFKTPTLRAVKTTGPYMHDGSLSSLAAVIEHYTQHKRVRKGLSALLLRKIDLSVEEKAQLVAFLKTL